MFKKTQKTANSNEGLKEKTPDSPPINPAFKIMDDLIHSTVSTNQIHAVHTSQHYGRSSFSVAFRHTNHSILSEAVNAFAWRNNLNVISISVTHSKEVITYFHAFAVFEFRETHKSESVEAPT